MTVISLASLSLLALVVTAAPLPGPNDSSSIERPSLDVQNTVQTVFASRLGQTSKRLGSESSAEPHTHVVSGGEQKDILVGINDVDIAAATDSLTFTASELKGSDVNNMLSVEILASNKIQWSEEGDNTTSQTLPLGFTRRHAVFTLTCAALGVTVGCVFGLLYLRYMLHTPVTHEAKDPEKAEDPRHATHSDTEHSTSEKPLIVDMSNTVRFVLDIPGTSADDKRCALQDGCSPKESEDSEDDPDEDFVDAEESPVSLLDSPVPDLPQIAVQHHADPDLLPLPTDRPSTPYSTPLPTPPRSPLRRPLQMREVSTSSSVARPAWSVRAADAPSLGLGFNATPHRPTSSPSSPSMRAVSLLHVSRPDTPVMHVPGAFSEEGFNEKNALAEPPTRSRAYQAPVPELDIAFAMQLRPGLGLGPDPAWLVRFLMAMFGWMTVFIGSGSQSRSSRRVIT